MHYLKTFGIAMVLLVSSCSSPTNGIPVKVDTLRVVNTDTVFIQKPVPPRDCVSNLALSYLGVTEATGNNDGPEIESFLALTGFGPGYAWCASFMSYLFHHCNVEAPISAWSPDWAKAGEVIWRQGDLPSKARFITRKADHFTIYYNSKKRVGHVGLILGSGHRLTTIEGNTNQEGSREGDGVYIKQRPFSMVYQINRVIDEQR